MQTSLKGFLVLFLVLSALVACNNTVQGVGKDMQENGRAIQKSAQ